ncbi:MAG: biotin--[acetyl-CoA-carboxylase] ligase, partial [Mycobacterium sp.]|nr:biotin--[acetyl-CoA-carboxylase] ligase [Mycobacterium sp.]
MSEPPHRPALDVDGVRHELVGVGRALKRLDVVQTTGSTNADLLARHGAGEDIDGVVLIAEHQSAGRGRNGRSWSTPPRSQIALSVGIAAGEVPLPAWGWVPLLTGVAVVDAVRA